MEQKYRNKFFYFFKRKSQRKKKHKMKSHFLNNLLYLKMEGINLKKKNLKSENNHKNSWYDWCNCLINYSLKPREKTANKLISLFKSNTNKS